MINMCTMWLTFYRDPIRRVEAGDRPLHHCNISVDLASCNDGMPAPFLKFKLNSLKLSLLCLLPNPYTKATWSMDAEITDNPKR